MYKTVEFKITDIFIPKGGNGKFTNDYCSSNEGIYPVYSSNTSDIFGKINNFDYDGHFLTWSIVGFAGYIMEINSKFSITNNRGILILKEGFDNIDLTYIKYILEPIFRRNKKGRMGFDGQNEYTTLNSTAIKNIEEKIEIPIKEDGSFDLEKQKELAKKYKNIEDKKKILLDKIEYLKKQKIFIDRDKSFNYKHIKFNDMFKLSRGKIISKPYILEHPGDYPVYSTQKGTYGHIDTYMKDGEYLIWNTDGLAGYIKKVTGKFSYTNIVGIMTPTKKIDMENISLDYLKVILEPIFRDNRKGRMGINGKNEYTKLNSTMIKDLDITIPIPVKEDDSFDLDKQQELAMKYASIGTIKQNVYNQIKELTSIVVN